MSGSSPRDRPPGRRRGRPRRGGPGGRAADRGRDVPAPDAPERGPLPLPRLARAAAVAAAVALAAAGCDDQLKHVDTFAFMVDGPAVETYEQQPRPHPEGAVSVDGGRRTYTLNQADTALTNPLEPSTENIREGQRAWTDFCLPCHGEGGAGDGPVINTSGDHPQRLPPLPTADLLSDRTRGYTDGYLYGMISNGRGLMPGYRRIPRETRWQLVLYVRHLQRTAAGESESSGAGDAGSGDAGSAAASESSQSTEGDGE